LPFFHSLHFFGKILRVIYGTSIFQYLPFQIASCMIWLMLAFRLINHFGIFKVIEFNLCRDFFMIVKTENWIMKFPFEQW
jgi:hypothetical protein